MLQLSNETPFAAERSVQLDPNGAQHWVVIIKATYRIDACGTLSVADRQDPVALAPKYRGEPGQSSLLRDTEMTYCHPGTDVIVNGTAHAAGGRRVEEMDVSVAVGPLQKTVRVIGEREWVPNVVDLRPSPPVPFVRMAIAYEQAYGGASPDDPGRLDERNPVGRGYGLRRSELAHTRLPTVEDPRNVIRGWRDRPVPAGFGAVAGQWSPRKERAGTYDAAWKQNKLPLLPDDFDPLFFVAAAPGLHSPVPLRGGEKVILDGFSENPSISFTLPREALLVDTYLGPTRVRQTVAMSRVIIEPDDGRLVVVWQSSLRCGPRFREIDRTRIDYKGRSPT